MGTMPERLFRKGVPAGALNMRWMRVKRVQAGLELEVVGVADAPVVVGTHYWRGRTIPCVGSRCPACETTLLRWFGYVGVRRWDGGKEMAIGNPFVLELPGRTFVQLVEDVGVHAPVIVWRGLRFGAQRTGGRRSPVLCDYRGRGACGLDLPSSEVERALCHLWQVPVVNGEGQGASWLREVCSRVESDSHYKR